MGSEICMIQKSGQIIYIYKYMIYNMICIFHQPRFPYSSTAMSPSLVHAGQGPHVGHALGSISTHAKFEKARLTSLMGASRRFKNNSSV